MSWHQEAAVGRLARQFARCTSQHIGICGRQYLRGYVMRLLPCIPGAVMGWSDSVAGHGSPSKLGCHERATAGLNVR